MQPEHHLIRGFVFAVASKLFTLSLLFGFALYISSYNVVRAQSANAPIIIGPGQPQVGSAAPKSNASSSKAGSVLFFHEYVSDSTQPDQVNTLVSLTNTNPAEGATLRLIAVHDCTTDEKFINLGPNQNRTLLMSREFPDSIGYMIAVTINSAGAPTQFNWIIGTATVRSWQGFEGSYNAFAVAKRSAGAVKGDGTSFALQFDGVQFDRLPQMVALDNIQGADGEVAIYSPPTRIGTASVGYNLKLKATIYDPFGTGVTSDVDGYACGLYDSIANVWSDKNLAGIIKKGAASWATFKAQDATDSKKIKDVPILGVSLGAIPNKSKRGAVTMHVLDWMESYTIALPTNALTVPAAPDVATQDQLDPTNGAGGASESRSGSILFFPRFLNGTQGSTLINLTNTHPAQKARVRLFFNTLSPVADISEKVISLEPLQAVSLNVGDYVTGQRGWVMAMAINSGAQASQFNYLIGSVAITDVNQFSTSYNALAVGKNSPGVVPRADDGKTSDLLFDDTEFDRLPATLGFSGVMNQSFNNSYLAYARLGNSILEAPSTRGGATVNYYDNVGGSYTALVGAPEVKIGDFKTYRFNPTLPSTALEANAGWFKLPFNVPVLAIVANYATNTLAPTLTEGWTGGLNGSYHLHILSNTEKFNLKVPSTNPNNNAPIAEAEGLNYEMDARSAAGTVVRLDARASSDPDPEDTLTFQWFDNGKLISEAALLDYRLSLGAHDLELIVTDSSGAPSDPYFQSVEVLDRTVPTISHLPNTVRATTTGGSAVVKFVLPVAFDSVDGPVAVTTSRQSGSVFPVGISTVTFTATDRAGNKATAILEIQVTTGTSDSQTGGDADSTAPFLANLEDQYVTPGEVRKIALEAQDADGDPVTFKLLGAPSGVALGNYDPVARRTTLFIGPLAATTRTWQVRVVASDNRRQSYTTEFFKIAVSDVPNNGTASGNGKSNRTPTAAMVPLAPTIAATAVDGVMVQLNGTLSNDPDLDSLTYSWSDNGVEIAQGAVADVKLGIGQHSIVLTVSDGRGGRASTVPSIVQVIPRSLAIISVTPSRLKRETDYMLTIIGTGFTAGAKVYLGSGINVSTPSSVSESSITVAISVTSAALVGGRDLFVINGDGKTAKLRAGVVVQ